MAKAISVEIYTASHRILGRVTPGATGLFSYLNIPTTSYVEIEGGHLSRLHQPGRMVARYETMWLVKSEIAAVLLSSRSELGPRGVSMGGYSTTVPHWVHIILGGYEFRGQIETAGKFNFGAVMFEGERFFMPLFHGELLAILFPNVKASSPALLLNRKMVDSMALLPKEEVPRIDVQDQPDS
jgi:hypothetical protein